MRGLSVNFCVIFLAINIFQREPYVPSSRRIWTRRVELLLEGGGGRTSPSKEIYNNNQLVIFRGESGPPAPPPSGSSHKDFQTMSLARNQVQCIFPLGLLEF